MKRTAFLSVCCAFFISVQAQKRIISYPFEFEKGFLARGDYDAYFLGYPSDSLFAIVLKDNKKAEYVLVNSNFKVVSKVQLPVESTVFREAISDYAGATTNGKQFHFVYSTRAGSHLETVDFENKAVQHKKLFEDTKEEKPLLSFSDYNRYYAITTNDKKRELVFYTVGPDGSLVQKAISFPVPVTAKQKVKLSEYLAGMKLIKSSEQPDLSTAVAHIKLISYPDRLQFVINDQDNPTHMVMVSLPDYTVGEKLVDYSDVIPAEGKAKLYISSFEKNGKLYSLLLNKKDIRVVVHNWTTGALINQYTINEETESNLFALQPVTERRMGKKLEEKEIELKKLIKAFNRGSEGLMVTENKAGQLIVTIGTYDLIPLSSGSNNGWVGGWQQSTIAASPTPFNNGSRTSTITRWNPYMYYRPGNPAYTTTSARYYNTSYFKLLLDPASLKVTRGRVPTAATDQIKDYMEGIDSKAKATNQFSIGKEQYYGYYDKDARAYVIDQIRIIQ